MPPAQQDALGMKPAGANMPDPFEPSFANKVPTRQHVHGDVIVRPCCCFRLNATLR